MGKVAKTHPLQASLESMWDMGEECSLNLYFTSRFFNITNSLSLTWINHIKSSFVVYEELVFEGFSHPTPCLDVLPKSGCRCTSAVSGLVSINAVIFPQNKETKIPHAKMNSSSVGGDISGQCRSVCKFYINYTRNSCKRTDKISQIHYTGQPGGCS